MIAVIDTNILVSGLWKPSGNPSEIVSRILTGKLKACYDYRIIAEYREVLSRPKFMFSKEMVSSILDVIVRDGVSVVPVPLPEAKLADEDDRPFYEVAKYCNAPLITGNIKDYPEDPLVMTPADFIHLPGSLK